MNIRNKNITTAAVVSAILFIAGALWWILLLNGQDSSRVWRALLINYLFFTSASAGMVVWPAIVISSKGKWMGEIEDVCWTGVLFSIPSVIILILLWLGSEVWAPWLHIQHGKEWWLDNAWLFSRNLAAIIIFWLIAGWFLRSRFTEKAGLSAGILIFVYALVFSLTGFDFVMALEPEWYTMMIGGYFFITGLYIAAALWAFLSVILVRPEKEKLHDLGKLIFAFAILSTYFMFSHLLPIWYGNIPHETSFVVPRWNYVWKWVSYFLLAAVYLGPVIYLLTEWSKKNYTYLAGASFIILAGMWIERWWLVSAVFEKERILFGVEEITATVSIAGLFVFLSLIGIKKLPERVRPGNKR